ncbi:hypothetical protein KW797_00520 [Candidatus Parcubacteria bacterium]|nr:hypothetical protein [Candidatus Parcubacteria bacterium]
MPSVNGSVSTGAGGNSVSTLTIAHTVAASLVNGLLMVFVTSPQFAAATGATWNGTAMTQVSMSSNNFWISCFYLRNPAAASANVVISFDTAANQPVATVVTFENAGVPSIKGTDSATGTAPSVTVVTTKDNSLLMEWMMSAAASHSQGAGQTELSNLLSNNGSWRHSSSYKGVATAGSASMSATIGSSQVYQMSVIVVPPPASNLGNMFLVF